MRKCICIIMILVLLSACSGRITSKEEKKITSSTVEDECTKDEKISIEILELIGKVIDGYTETVDSLIEPYSYCTIVDLNQNGNPEIVIAACVGSGYYTYFSVSELDMESNTEIRFDEFDFRGNDFFERAPDIIQDRIEGFYDKKNETIKYYVTDMLRGGGYIEHIDLLELSFGRQKGVKSVLCVENELTDSGDLVSSFFDAEGNDISKEEYEHRWKEIENHCNVTYELKWMKLSDLSSDNAIREEQLNELYNSQTFIIRE